LDPQLAIKATASLFDYAGRVYFADEGNFRIRVLTPLSVPPVVPSNAWLYHRCGLARNRTGSETTLCNELASGIKSLSEARFDRPALVGSFVFLVPTTWITFTLLQAPSTRMA
jgi:hypothetical protein